MNFEEKAKTLEAAVANGSATLKDKGLLSSLHFQGVFPGANPQRGLELLIEAAKPDNYEDMLELGILYFKGERVSKDANKGMALIVEAVENLDDVPFEHCFALGMEFSQIKEPDFQRMSKNFLELALANKEGMAQLEQHMGQQGVMMINGMLQAVKGWLSTA